MDLRVRSLGSSIPGSASPSGSTSGKLRIKSENQPEATPLDESTRKAATGKTLADGNAAEFARRAENAVEAISDLRSRQLALAQEASVIADPEKMAQLEAERNDLENEISRVGSSATFQGENVLAGKALTVEDRPVSLANFSSLAQDPGAVLSTHDDAVAAVSALSESLMTSRYASAGAESAATKANTDFAPINNEISPSSRTEQEVRDPAKADELAREIAQSLRARSTEDPGESLLVHNLDPQRSKELLE